MRKNSKILITIFLTFLVSLPFFVTYNLKAEQSWESAFYNDVNGDGVKELLPLIYNNTTTYTYNTLIQENNFIPKDQAKYGFVDKSLPDSYNSLLKKFYKQYGFIPKPSAPAYKKVMSELIATYGEDSDEIKAIEARVAEICAIREKEILIDQKAEELRKADQDKYIAENPNIKWGHEINPFKTTTEVTENTLLYWLHVPYDYDETKSYPVMVYAHGEDLSLTIDRYVNEDGTYKVSKANMSTDINGFMTQWYNYVKDPGENRDKYDCFFIYICNTNKFFRGTNKGFGIVSQHNDYDADTIELNSDITNNSSYNASYDYTYDASRLSAGINEQLLCSLIDELASNYSIDLTRQYVAGFSLGGIFTMDIISHYPNRFAAAVPICTASADISEENCKNLTNTNIWAISGANDGTCSKYFSKFFVQEVNKAREKYGTGTNNVAQYSFFAGGHSGGYFSPTLRSASEGVSITKATDVIDFVFNSKRSDVSSNQMQFESEEINSSKVDVIASKNVVNNSFDVLLIGTDFVGNYIEKGFVVDFEFSDGKVKTYIVEASEIAQTITTTIDNSVLKVKADSYEALALFGKTIRNIPIDVCKIKVKTYAQSLMGEYYSFVKEYMISVKEGVIYVEK